MFSGNFPYTISMRVRPVRGVAVTNFILAAKSPLQSFGGAMMEGALQGLGGALAGAAYRAGQEPSQENQALGSIYLIEIGKSYSGGQTAPTTRDYRYVPLKKFDSQIGMVSAAKLVAGGVMAFAAIGFIFALVMAFASDVERMMVRETPFAPIAFFGGILSAIAWGGATFWQYYVPERERAIRENIGDLTGYPIDPAIVREDAAQMMWARYAGECSQYATMNVAQATHEAAAMGIASGSANSPARRQALLSLLHARVSIALGGDATMFERHTDTVLASLR